MWLCEQEAIILAHNIHLDTMQIILNYLNMWTGVISDINCIRMVHIST